MNDNTPTASIRIDESDKPVVVKTVIVSQDSIDEIAEAVAKKLRQPERKKGKWNHGLCSVCGYDWGKDAPIANVPSFCPNCGSDNRGEQDD